jgi:hypothetical protein
MTDDIHRCSLCGVAFKPEDICADDITEGTCHAECLEGSPVVDLETGDEIPGNKIDTYLYSEIMEQPGPQHSLPSEPAALGQVFTPQLHDESAGFERVPSQEIKSLQNWRA